MVNFGTEVFKDTAWINKQYETNSFIIVNGVLIDAKGCSGKVTVPDYVTSIISYVFRNNKDITEVIIPESITQIENFTFSQCSNMKSLTIMNPYCKIGDYSNTIPENTVIYSYPNSFAEQYAKSHNLEFIALDGETKPQYTYEIIPLIAPFNSYYYIKTDNPDPYSFRFVDKDSIYGEDAAITFIDEFYADVVYENEETKRVNGGYLFKSKNTDGGEVMLQLDAQTTPPIPVKVYNITTGEYHIEYERNEIWVDMNHVSVLPKLYNNTDYLIQNYAVQSGFFENMDAVQKGLSSICFYSRSYIRGELYKSGTEWFLSNSPHIDQSFLIQNPYSRKDSKQLLAASIYPFTYDSIGFPNMMANVAIQLDSSVKCIQNSKSHAFIDVTRGNETRSYGGSGNIKGQGIDESQIIRKFDFVDDNVVFTLDNTRKLLEQYSALDVHDDMPTNGRLTWSDVCKTVGNGAWIKMIGISSIIGGTYNAFGYVYDLDGGIGYASDTWVDGRYIDEYERFVAGETFNKHPESSIILFDVTVPILSYDRKFNNTTKKYEYSNVAVNEAKKNVRYLYDKNTQTWKANDSFVNYNTISDIAAQGLIDSKYLKDLILTYDEVVSLGIDRNTNVSPKNGYIYDGTAKPGTKFDDTIISYTTTSTTTKKFISTTSTTTAQKSTSTTSTTTAQKSTTTIPDLSVGKTNVTLINGDQYTIIANRMDVSFKTNNPDVAIVSPKGVITAVGIGNATISVIDSESNAVQIKITVTSVVTESTTTSTTTTTNSSTTTTTTTSTTTTTIAISTTSKYQGFYYKKIENGIEITGIDDTVTGNVTIPEEINGLPVIRIGEYASLTRVANPSGDIPNNDDGLLRILGSDYELVQRDEITSVSIPSSVKEIGTCAFCGCKNLKQVSFSYGLERIEPCAFVYSGITELILPDSVKYIGASAFCDCSDLSKVSLSKNLEFLGMYNFVGSKLDTISNGDFIVDGWYITYKAFKASPPYDAEYPNVISIPEGTIGIAEQSYSYIAEKENDTTKIIIPSTVKTISDNAFRYYLGLKEFNIVSDNPYFTVENGILYNKNKTKLIRFPAACPTADFTFPSTVTSTCSWAFCNCQNLNSVIMNNNLSDLGGAAFLGCKSLKFVTFSRNISNLNSAIYYYSVGLKGSVECVGTFQSCESLEEITVPKNINYIGDATFALCKNLKKVTVKNPNCEIINNEDYEMTFRNGLYDDHFNEVDIIELYGYKDSTLHTYAQKYNKKFVELTTTLTLGDVNNDGMINAVDASSVLSYYAMISTNKNGGFNDAQQAAADVDHDGQINAVDASCILSYYAYVSTTKEEIMSIDEYLNKE